MIWTKTSVNWTPKLKNYPHFDSLISCEDAKKLANNPELVKSHKFLPFLSYTNITKKFGNKKPKKRLILYAAHRDAQIYSRYRATLMDCYEEILKKDGLGDYVTAYRKIPCNEGKENGNKCNINFAKEAFEEIKRRKNCIALALDISQFFESLDHKLIKEKWCRLLNVTNLPDDHYAVYKHITNYKMVDFNQCYERLGLMEEVKYKNNVVHKKYTYSRKNQPKQLCKMEEFREKIVGKNSEYNSLIHSNPHIDQKELRGIPQGSPISDIIANMYMLDFDRKIKLLADKNDWYYRRYSDDILLIIPHDTNIKAVENDLNEAIKSECNRTNPQYLKLNNKKTIRTKFYQTKSMMICKNIDLEGATKGQHHSFEYLGFSFNSEKMQLKSQTLGRYYKKTTHIIEASVRAARQTAEANGLKDIKQYLDISTIYNKCSYSNKEWQAKRKKENKPYRNFMSYVRSAANIMSDDDSINKQVRRHKRFINKMIVKKIAKYATQI